MPRLTRSPVWLALGLVLFAAAAGDVVGVHAVVNCVVFSPSDRVSVEHVDVIVIGQLAPGGEQGQVAVEPEAYLKGSAERQAFVLEHPAPERSPQELATWECPPAPLEPGARVLLALNERSGALDWPDTWHVYVLRDGMAISAADPAFDRTETVLIDQIRSITGQYVVPAEGAGTFSIQGSNIAILVVALVVVFGIGLALMRVWHRIDPT